jgi:hypothetical protein
MKKNLFTTKSNSMKKIILTTAIGLLSFLAAHAQQCYMSGYGAVQLRHSQVNGSGNVLIGGYGGWLLNERLMIGAGGFGTVQDIDVQAEGNAATYGMGYSGFVAEYNLPLSQQWQVVGGALIGGGRFETEQEDGRSLRSDLFVAEPHVQITYAISPWIQAVAGIQYRIVSSDELPDTVNNNDLSSLSLGIGLRVGIFPQKTE